MSSLMEIDALSEYSSPILDIRTSWKNRENKRLHVERTEVTPLEISAATEVSRTDRISIRMSLTSASAVVERGSLSALASGSSLLFQQISNFC
ncbi:MAG: hypothetical protein ACFFCZ_29515 [Promethearchaeota archaeon]